MDVSPYVDRKSLYCTLSKASKQRATSEVSDLGGGERVTNGRKRRAWKEAGHKQSVHMIGFLAFVCLFERVSDLLETSALDLTLVDSLFTLDTFYKHLDCFVTHQTTKDLERDTSSLHLLLIQHHKHSCFVFGLHSLSISLVH